MRRNGARIECRRRVRLRRGLADRDELRKRKEDTSERSEDGVDNAPADPTRQNPAVSLR
jgi:hypothetical protein